MVRGERRGPRLSEPSRRTTRGRAAAPPVPGRGPRARPRRRPTEPGDPGTARDRARPAGRARAARRGRPRARSRSPPRAAGSGACAPRPRRSGPRPGAARCSRARTPPAPRGRTARPPPPGGARTRACPRGTAETPDNRSPARQRSASVPRTGRAAPTVVFVPVRGAFPHRHGLQTQGVAHQGGIRVGQLVGRNDRDPRREEALHTALPEKTGWPCSRRRPAARVDRRWPGAPDRRSGPGQETRRKSDPGEPGTYRKRSHAADNPQTRRPGESSPIRGHPAP